jgi:site-specific recombinase XerD
MIERAAATAKLGIKAHAHMLRHACGFKLANDGVDTRSLQSYLGHRNIQNTTRYTALAPDRFQGLLAGLVALERQEAGLRGICKHGPRFLA